MTTLKLNETRGETKSRGLALLLATLLAIVLLSTLVTAAPPLSPDEIDLARQDATVRIEPVQSVVDVGETFTISVTIDDASDLGGFEFTMLFITTTVTVDSVTMGDFPGSTGRMTIPIGPTIDNQAGRVNFAVATVGADPGPSGTGELAVIGLTAQGVGSSPLDLQDVLVLNTKAEHQTTTIEDGTVVAGETPPFTKVFLPIIMKLW